MRRLAFALAAVWMIVAFAVRLNDMRRPQIYVSALAGGQRHHLATVAWIEGAVSEKTGPLHRGRLLVADVRIDGKVQRYASSSLPEDWLECRLWLEESVEVIQAVALCPGHFPIRLTANGQSVAGLGPNNRPGVLYQVYPLTSVEPEKVVSRIHRGDLAPAHPLLLLLGLGAMVPLCLLGWRQYQTAQRLRGRPVVEGVMEHTKNGALTIRDGDRRVTVFVEQGEVLSVGLGRRAISGDDTMVVDGLRAAVQGEVERQSDGAFRGAETLRLRRGALLVVGDVLIEARRRLYAGAARDAALAAAGAALASLMAAGYLW